MKPKFFSSLAVIIVLLVSPTGNATVITQTVTPLATLVTVPCAAVGAGEMVYLTGDVHAVFAVTYDANGGQHVTTHINNVGVSGIGLITGNKYQATGGDSFVSNDGGPGSEFTFVNNFGLTAPGPGNNLRVHELIHATLNANGELTADIVNITVDCG